MLKSKQFFSFKDGKTYINLRVTTKASKNCIFGVRNGELLVSVTAVPENNKANAMIIDLVSKNMRIAKTKIHVVSGEKCRNKKICIEKMFGENELKSLAIGEFISDHL
jgi:uncharacterized protein (TIGR00251 family)